MTSPKPVKYQRTPYLVVERDTAKRKDVYGSIGDAVVLHAQLLRGEEPSSTAIVAMHPIGSPGYLPMFSGLARQGFHVIASDTRYSTGDAALQMENVLLDLGAVVQDARERLGYERIILAGWSGGGSLMMGYQAQAEQPWITQTAAGEDTPLADQKLIPADGVMILAAHRSRHHLLTDFLDASITDESRPHDRVRDLNLYDPLNPSQPPYPPGFLTTYRAAQLARNRRITAYAKQHLDDLRGAGRDNEEHCFIVYGTMADPRWLDVTVDPNGRAPGSQWSFDDAQVDAVEAAARISVPVLIVENSRDNACPPAHPQAIFAALPHEDKQYQVIEGANHYYSGQREHLQAAGDVIQAWITAHGFAG
jgi:pimeloyl-ACP methyl ester carboxylesterase